MPILQHYYTSYENEVTGLSGWQTKASSRGITPDLEKTIKGLLNYKAPQSLSAADITNHPIALRYMYDSSYRGFLLCSQSTGLDNQQRPGNFFAHTLVIPPEDFSSFILFPPILAWYSPIWQCEDHSQSQTLPALEIEALKEGLDIQRVWEFLAQGSRKQMLNQLLCVLVHRKRTSQRIILLDANNNIAWWIAALTMHLPPDYYPFLSFATYHHAPLEQPYLITGTSRDWWQRVAASPQTQNFFVLDAEREKRSHKVTDSSYARLVTSISSYEEFQQELLPLFQRYARRFPPRGEIDEQLELFAHYVHLFKGREVAPLSDNEFLALKSALDSFQPEDQDTEELEHLRDILHVQNRQDMRVGEALMRVQGLLERCQNQARPIFTRSQSQNKAEMIASAASSQPTEQGLAEYTPDPVREPNANAHLEALMRGRLESGKENLLYEQMKMLLPAEYQAVIGKCIPGFFRQAELTYKTQHSLVDALFTRNHNYAAFFWETYWVVFKALFEQPSTASQLLNVLDFWFNLKPDDTFQQKYIQQDFFLHVSIQLSQIRKNSRTPNGIEAFCRLASQPNYWWYHCIQSYLAREEPSTGSLLSRSISGLVRSSLRFWKNLDEPPESKHGTKLNEKIVQLFEREKALEQLGKQIKELYLQCYYVPEQPFWSGYWRGLKAIVISRDFELFLNILDFWFDESAQALTIEKHVEEQYIRPEFFIGFPLVLRELYNTQKADFRELDKQMSAFIQNYPGKYRWYLVVSALFREIETNRDR